MINPVFWGEYFMLSKTPLPCILLAREVGRRFAARKFLGRETTPLRRITDRIERLCKAA